MAMLETNDSIDDTNNEEKTEFRGKILVVDDECEARRKIASTLEQANFSVTTAENGMQAIKLVDAEPFDLVLLDVVMDTMDGFKVCQFLKSKKDFFSPIIFISLRASIDDILMGFKLGADDYITKPFKAEELIARVEVGLRLKSYQDRLRLRQTDLEQSNIDLESSKLALERKINELRTIFETFSLMHATLNPAEIARGAALSMMGHKGMEFGLILSQDIEKRNFLVPIFFQGLENFSPSDFWFSKDEAFIKWLEKLGRPLKFEEVPQHFLKVPNIHLLSKYMPHLIIPMIADDVIHGVLFFGARVMNKEYSSEDMEFLEMISLELSAALKKAEFYLDLKMKSEELERVIVDTLGVLGNAIEARDRYTIGHTWRVCRFAQALAKELTWDEEKINQIEIGGLLHDIGKIGVDDGILRKKSPLNDDEYKRMKDHPEMGAKMLSNIDFLKPYIPYILFHQERYDGKGYPMQLKGKEIPLEGRLLSVADAFDAMTSDRPYRAGLPPEKAINEIVSLAGKQFDPVMAHAFARVYRAGKLNLYLQKKDKSKAKLTCPICQSSLDLKDLLLKGTEYMCPICKHTLEVSIRSMEP